MNTMAEILAAARRQLRACEEFNIRSVAAEIGLSSQGLYRYVDSIDQLRFLVTQQIVDSMLAFMGRACARYSDPDERIVAAAVAFRTWALHNPIEFRHAFTAPRSAPGGGDQDAVYTPQRVGSFFAPLFVELRGRLSFAVPTELDPTFDPTQAIELIGPQYPPLAGTDTATMVWMFQYCWARLYGIVALEAFQQIDPAYTKSGLFFTVTLREIAGRLNIADLSSLERVFYAESDPLPTQSAT